MLRLTICCASCLLGAATTFAQSDEPAEREPVYTKEDIFDRLTPLASASATESPATESPATPPAEAQEASETEKPTTTVEIRQPDAVTPAQSQTTTAPPTNIEPPPTIASSATPAPLSPKLRAMLRPSGQASGAAAKLPAHAPGAMTKLSAEELRTLIGYVADEFNAELGKLKHGERWQSYLRLEELEAACRVGVDMETVEKLPAIGLRFASLEAKPEYSALTKRNGFRTLNLALREFLSLNDQRSARQQLLGGVTDLQRSLAPVATGAQWSGYFELAALSRLGASPQAMNDHDLVQLQLILARFEQAASDERFAAVAKLQGFHATQGAIRAILGVAQRPAPPDDNTAQPEAVADAEVTIPDDDSTPLAQASATVERLPLAGEGWQLVALGGKAFLKRQNEGGWKQIGKASAVAGDAITARDETAQLVCGESFALQLAAQTTLNVARRPIDGVSVTQLNLTQGSVKAIANSRTGGSEVLYLAAGKYQLAVSGDDFAVEFSLDKKDGRVVAIVHAGQAAVENGATGDTAVVRAGREAVLLAGGIALRAAPAKSENWWPTPAERPRSARRSEGGFSQ